jgi:hypothetical protein
MIVRAGRMVRASRAYPISVDAWGANEQGSHRLASDVCAEAAFSASAPRNPLSGSKVS